MNGFDPWWPPQTAFTSQGSPYSSPQTLTDFSSSPITDPSLDPQTAFASLEPPYLEPAPSATPASPTLIYPTSNLLDPSYSATYPLPLDTAPVILSTDAAPAWSQTIPPSALSQASDSFPVDQSQTDADPTPIVNAARERGLLVITCGTNTLRFVPPLVITEAEINEGMEILADAMESVWGKQVQV